MAFTGFNLSNASSIYYGSTPVREVWKGSTKIWPLTAPPSPLVGVPTITSVGSGFLGLGSPYDTGWMANVNFNEVQGAVSYTCHFGNVTHTITQSEVEQIGFGSTGDFFIYPYVGGETVNVYMTATNGVSTVSSSTVSHYIEPDGPVVGNDIYISISVLFDGSITWQSSDIIYTGVGFGPQTFYLSPIVIESYGASDRTITGATGSITIYDHWSHTATDHGSCGTVAPIWPNPATIRRIRYGGAVCTSASSGSPVEWYDDYGNRVVFAHDVPYSDLED